MLTPPENDIHFTQEIKNNIQELAAKHVDSAANVISENVLNSQTVSKELNSDQIKKNIMKNVANSQSHGVNMITITNEKMQTIQQFLSNSKNSVASNHCKDIDEGIFAYNNNSSEKIIDSAGSIEKETNQKLQINGQNIINQFSTNSKNQISAKTEENNILNFDVQEQNHNDELNLPSESKKEVPLEIPPFQNQFKVGETSLKNLTKISVEGDKLENQQKQLSQNRSNTASFTNQDNHFSFGGNRNARQLSGSNISSNINPQDPTYSFGLKNTKKSLSENNQQNILNNLESVKQITRTAKLIMQQDPKPQNQQRRATSIPINLESLDSHRELSYKPNDDPTKVKKEESNIQKRENLGSWFKQHCCSCFL